jgi:hypothetical protein
MSRHAKMIQPELFDTVDCSPLFSGIPVPVPEPSRPTVTPDAPTTPVASWDWVDTLTPTTPEPEPLIITPEQHAKNQQVYKSWWQSRQKGR